jgi:hypothetical protein
MIETRYSLCSSTFLNYCAHCGGYFTSSDTVYYSNSISNLIGKAFCSEKCAELYLKELGEKKDRIFAENTKDTWE